MVLVGNVWYWSLLSVLSPSSLTHSVFHYDMKEMPLLIPSLTAEVLQGCLGWTEAPFPQEPPLFWGSYETLKGLYWSRTEYGWIKFSAQFYGLFIEERED